MKPRRPASRCAWRRANARRRAAPRPFAQGRAGARACPSCADPRDRALVEAICFAALRQPRALRGRARSLDRPNRCGERDSELRALLLVGFAQLDALQLPAHAAVDVDGRSRARARPHAPGRHWSMPCCAARSAKACPPAIRAARIGRHGCASACAATGRDDAEPIFAASARAAPLWLRVNRRAQSRDAYRRQLQRGRYRARSVDASSPDALRLDDADRRARAAGLRRRRRLGAGRPRAAASPMRWRRRPARACSTPAPRRAARPRTCSNAIASLRLTALDIDARRLRPRAGTLRAPAASATACGCTRPTPPILRRGGTACPSTPCCSMRRARPPASCGASPTCCCIAANPTSPPLVATQARLLDALWRTLAPGGVLLYATCSILKDENERRSTPSSRARRMRRPRRWTRASAASAAPAASACRANTAWTASSTRA